MSIEILDPVAEAEEASADRRTLRKLGWVGWVSLGVIVLALLHGRPRPDPRPLRPQHRRPVLR